MNNDKPKKDRAFSPSRTVWRTQMAKGIYTPHRVSRITCIVNQLITKVHYTVSQFHYTVSQPKLHSQSVFLYDIYVITC